MALTATSFSSASMVAKVKMAMHEAALGCGFADVYNRKGKMLMLVVHTAGRGFAFYSEGVNVTKAVVAGARRYHAN